MKKKIPQCRNNS